ncbi:MAG: calcium-binding protein, partial [Saezia sp.]
AADILATRSGDNLVLSLRNSTDTITVGYHFYEDGNGGYAIHGVEFADGTKWTPEQLKQLVVQSGTGRMASVTMSQDYSVDSLVSAMAAFDVPAAGQTSLLSQQQQTNLIPMLAAS